MGKNIQMKVFEWLKQEDIIFSHPNITSIVHLMLKFLPLYLKMQHQMHSYVHCTSDCNKTLPAHQKSIMIIGEVDLCSSLIVVTLRIFLIIKWPVKIPNFTRTFELSRNVSRSYRALVICATELHFLWDWENLL